MATTTIDLDLTTIDSNDPDALAAKIETFYKQDSAQKNALSYHWEKNHMMLDGQQWLVYEGSRDTGGLWTKLRPNSANEYIPRPVTNYLFDSYQTLKGYLLKTQPRLTVRPNTQNSQDKVAAKLAKLILDCNWERMHEDENYEVAASCLLTYGTVFKKDFWDNSSLSKARVPKMIDRPVIDPATGMPSQQTEMVQEVDAQGYPVFEELSLGDIQTAIVEPYRLALDPLAITLSNMRWVMEYSIKPLTWIRENYGKEDPGYTGRASEVKEEKNLSAAMRRFMQLKTSAGVKSVAIAGSGVGNDIGEGEMISQAAVVKEYYERPTEKYPKGRLMVVANAIPLYIGDSPYEGPEDGDWHPYSECRWEIVPGRFWGKGPFDDATEVQKQINSIDSVIILTRKTTAVPQKLVPKGTLQHTTAWTGMPGLRVPYTPGPSGEKPETIPAQGVDQTVFAEREQKVNDLKNITGAVDILKGDRPPGVTAHSALSLLFEVATGKISPVLKRWKRLHECSSKKQLRQIAKKYREPRPEFIRMLLSRNKELTEDQIKTFIGTDLYDNCNVIMEASSSIPKLEAAENAKLMELAPMGVLNLENPKNKAEFLERMGIIGFDSEYTKDAQRASWENDLIDNLPNSPDNRPIRLETDNDEIHISVHSERTKEPSFMSLPSEVQQMYFQHIQEHQMAIEQREQMAQMQAMAMGQPPQPPPPNPMQNEEPVRKGKGISREMQNAMASDLTQSQFRGSTK